MSPSVVANFRCEIPNIFFVTIRQLLRYSAVLRFQKSRCHHIETSQLICSANRLTGFYMMAILAFNELNEDWIFLILLEKRHNSRI